MRKRSKCWWTSQHAGGPARDLVSKVFLGHILSYYVRDYAPPKPVAMPTVPSVASISMRNEPRTLMPQLVLELRYCSHREQGVEMGLSISLFIALLTHAVLCVTRLIQSSTTNVPVATLDIVVVTAGTNAANDKSPNLLDGGERSHGRHCVASRIRVCQCSEQERGGKRGPLRMRR